MIDLKVRRIGNSLGIVLPKDIIKRLRAREGDRLLLFEAADGSVRMSRYNPTLQKKMEKAEEIMDRYRNTLHVLAK